MGDKKAEKLAQLAMENDWETRIVPKIPENATPDQIEWNLYGKRGEEVFHVVYLGSKWHSCTYVYGDCRLRPQYRNNLVRLITGRPDPKRYALKNVSASAEKLIESRKLPWTDESPAMDILLGVLNKKIKWVRKIDGEVCESSVIYKESNLGKKHFKVYESPPNSGKRILEWADREGFHAVRIDQIIEVA